MGGARGLVAQHFPFYKIDFCRLKNNLQDVLF